MVGNKNSSGQNSATRVTTLAAVYVTSMIALIIFYLSLHWQWTTAGNAPYFYLDTVGGRAAELAFWSALGVLYAGLGRLAKIMILPPPSAFSRRHFILYGLKRVAVAWAAVLLLGFASGLLLMLSPDLTWLAVDNRLALAAGLIPASFLLGFFGNVADSFFRGLLDGVKKKVSELRKGGTKNGLNKTWDWLKHSFKKTLWLGDSKQ